MKPTIPTMHMKCSLTILALGGLLATTGAYGRNPADDPTQEHSAIQFVQDATPAPGSTPSPSETSPPASATPAPRDDQGGSTPPDTSGEGSSTTQRDRTAGTMAGAPRIRTLPYLGVVTGSVDPALSAQLGLAGGLGLMVESVEPSSPAATAGLQRFDVLRALNEQLLFNTAQLAGLVRFYGYGTEVRLTVLRKGQEQTITVKIGDQRQADRPVPSGRSESAPGAPQSGDPMEQMHRRMRERRERLEQRMREDNDQARNGPRSGRPGAREAF